MYIYALERVLAKHYSSPSSDMLSGSLLAGMCILFVTRTLNVQAVGRAEGDHGVKTEGGKGGGGGLEAPVSAKAHRPLLLTTYD